MKRFTGHGLLIAIVGALVLSTAAPTVMADDQHWAVRDGRSVIVLDQDALRQAGLRVAPLMGEPRVDGAVILSTAPETPNITLSGDVTEGHFSAMQIFHREGIAFSTSTGQFNMGSALIDASYESAHYMDPGFEDAGPRLLVSGGDRMMDMPTMTYSIQGASLLISPKLAEQLGQSKLAFRSIGTMALQLGFEMPNLEHEDPLGQRVCSSPTSGPDVIVGALEQGGGGGTFANYAAVGTIDAFAVATYSCNIGNVNVNWISGNNQHPVIGGAMYRRKVVNGATRFEQIGVAWLKHGFLALTDSICCTCNGQGGSVLGQGCADPYTAGRNGTQQSTSGGLGPRFQVNAHTGAFTFPYMYRGVPLPGGGDTNITRRIQVQGDDLNPALNGGAQYYAEAQYVTADDAANGNQNNNASYLPCTISGAGPDYSGSAVAGTTVRMKSAIQAWKAFDSTVTETLLDVPEDGGTPTARLILSAQATDLGNGFWHYEYALYNMNSDRCVQAFSIPVSPSVTVQNIGFHDVFYHSFDGCGSSASTPITFDGTDWPGFFAGGSVTWKMVALTGTGANAPCNSNALRFGTTYNFRFDANIGPTNGSGTITQWKAVNDVSAATVIPSAILCIPPVLDPIQNDSIACGSSYSSGAPSTSSGTGPLTWTLEPGSPAGMTINPSNGVVSWSPAVTTGSPYTITTKATNSCGSSSQNWTLTVNANAPSINTIVDANAVCGVSYTSAAPTASGGAAPLAWSLLAGPPGMTINASTGAVTWPSPDMSGSPYTVTIQAASANGCGTDSKSWTLTVNPNPPLISGWSISNRFTPCGVPFTSPAPIAIGGATPIAWSLVSGPAGMTINPSTGVVSWPSPDASGSPYTITIKADSANSCGSDSRSWTLTVTPNPPSINSISNAFAVCGASYTSVAPTTTGGGAPLAWSLLAGPAGMTIDGSTGAVTWPSPVATGSPFTVTVQTTSTSNCGTSAPQSWQLGVVIGDFDADGLISESDISGFVNDLLLDIPICAGDLNGDGLVDGNDIPVFNAALGL